MRKLALRPWFDSSLEALGALSNLFQCRFKSSQLFRARIGKDSPNFGGVFPKNRSNQSSAFCCERYDADATCGLHVEGGGHSPEGSGAKNFRRVLLEHQNVQIPETL